MRLSKFDIFQVSIIALVLAVCAAAIPVMSQTSALPQPVTQTNAAAPL